MLPPHYPFIALCTHLKVQETKGNAHIRRSCSHLQSPSLNYSINPFLIHTKLEENDEILSHRSERSDQPRQIREHILPLEGVEEDTRAIGDISHE